jgi:tRNA threonylcarbamoyladenosine biosynthesis protein TsaE
MKSIEWRAANPEATEALGARLAAVIPRLRLVTVRGPLGAGKTTLVRGMLRGFGHSGTVKSPTFTLVEPYVFGDLIFNHFDFYRVKDPEELEFLGLRDYLREGAVCVVEWPERAGALLPEPDIAITIDDANGDRRVQLTARNRNGEAALEALT